MFQQQDSSLIGGFEKERSTLGGVVHRNSGQNMKKNPTGSVGISVNHKNIPLKLQNKSRIRISTESMNQQNQRRNSQDEEQKMRKKMEQDEVVQFQNAS
jgi:hypothetical protein